MPEYRQKITENRKKIRNGICCCYNIGDRVQGLLPNKEICPNIARKSQKNKKNFKNDVH